MKTATALIPLVALSLVLAQGPAPQPQPRPQQPPDFGALKSYLNLSDAQVRQMQQARQQAARAAEEKDRDLRPQIEEKHRALADLLDKDNADPTAVGKLMLEIRGLERQIRQAHEAVRTAEIDVMTPEQKAKFKAIQDAAMLPEATREAQRLGLVPPPPQGQGPFPNGPQPGAQQPMMFPGQPPQPGVPGQPMRPVQPPPPQPRPGGREGGR